MSKSTSRNAGQPAADLLEDAVRLLRSAPPSAYLLYYAGSIPGMLAALYFFADLSGSADAEARVFPASVGMALAYVWMKSWQTIFAVRLRSVLLQEEAQPWTLARIGRMAVAQGAIQPLGFILRPLAGVLFLPTVFTSSFFQNVTVLGDGEHGKLRDLWISAYRVCRLWPMQMHVAFAWTGIFRIFVWLNVFITMLAIPFALKMFFGVETMFTRHWTGMFNLTFFATSFAATYLCMGPINKAVNVLRCFRGTSLQSGADLLLELRTVRRNAGRASAMAAALLLLCAVLLPHTSVAELKAEPKVQSEQLNRSLDDVLERREFAWRAPRERKKEVEDNGWFAQVMKDFSRWLDKAAYKVGKLVKKAVDWLSSDRKSSSNSGSWLSMAGSMKVLIYVLIGVAAILLIVLVSRFRRRPKTEAAAVEANVPRPDLREEHVTADQLPEDGWLQMARELMQSGELRLALRAMYLATLAHLGQRDYIRLARHKSNRDYNLELRRRARAQPDLLAAFGRNLEDFERVWYGEHSVTTNTLGEFTERLERIRAC